MIIKAVSGNDKNKIVLFCIGFSVGSCMNDEDEASAFHLISYYLTVRLLSCNSFLNISASSSIETGAVIDQGIPIRSNLSEKVG